jgi:hypothetical protein
MTRSAKHQSDREFFENLIPGFSGAVDGYATKLEEVASNLLSDAALFRRRIAVSPYERLMLAGRLVSMCEAEADEMLRLTIGELDCDDVLASINGLAAKVRALKARAIVPRAAE